jgi:hypothetical protein
MDGSPQVTSNNDNLNGGAETAWRGLTAFANWSESRPSGSQLAEQIARDATAGQSSLAIRNFLHEILVDWKDDPDSPVVLADVSELIEQLSTELLAPVLGAEPDARRGVQFLGAVASRLSLGAVLRCVSLLAESHERPIPEAVRASMMRFAERLPLLPEEARSEAEAAFRDSYRQRFLALVADGAEGRSEPDGGPEKLERRTPGRTIPEADRLVEMAIECDVVGPAVWIALQEVMEEKGIASVIDVMKTAPEDSVTAASVMQRIGTPQELRSLLRAEPFDGAAVDALLRGMRVTAANVLLEELVESQARLTRRYLMERLARYGTELRPLVEARLKDSRWFVQRNMLSLLRSTKCPADIQLATKFMAHKDARVRREAVLWCLDTPATRDEAMVAALSDTDVTVLRPAMQAARGHFPASAAPILSKRVMDPAFPPEFRVLGLTLLGRSGSILALEALLHFAQNGRTLLGKPRLAPKSPEMLAALSGLARSWDTERRAAVLLELARKSRDTEIAAAAVDPPEEAAA